MLQIRATLSENEDWRMLDYIPECHIEQIYANWADCADSSLPLIPETLRYGQGSGSELESSGMQPVLTSFFGYGIPQPFPSSPSGHMIAVW